MNIKDFSQRMTASALNEQMTKLYGERIALDKFSDSQLVDARNKLRTQLRSIETNESFDSVQKPKYTKTRLMLDILNKEIDNREITILNTLEEAIKQRISEGATSEAEIVVSANDMVDKITSWMENTAEMQATVLTIGDQVRDELGNEVSEKFISIVKPTLGSIYDAMEKSRVELIKSVQLLSGEDISDTMGADDVPEPEDNLDSELDDLEADSETETDDDLDVADDDFSSTKASAGGSEPSGRERRESTQRQGRAISEKASPVKKK